MLDQISSVGPCIALGSPSSGVMASPTFHIMVKRLALAKIMTSFIALKCLCGFRCRSSLADVRLQLKETQQEKAEAVDQASALQEQLEAAMQQISTVASRMADVTADTRGHNEEVNSLQDQLAAKTVQHNEQDKALEGARCVSFLDVAMIVR